MLYLKHLWLLPYTLIGLLTAILSGAKFKGMVHPEKTFEFIDFRGPLRWYMDKFGFAGVTIGAVILYVNDRYRTVYMQRHERCHVRQGFKWGFIWPVVYYGDSLLKLLDGKLAYWDNRFEVEARAAEKIDT